MRMHRDFNDIRNATLDPGGRNDIPRPKPRARGCRTEIRPSGGTDIDHDQPQQSKRRAAGGRSRKSKLMHMAGETAKHRVDRAPRRKKQKLADGGAPYGGATGYVPAVQLQPAHFSAPVAPQTPDFTQQMISAGIGMLGKNWPKNDDDSKNEKPVDTGYAVYSNGTPIGIKGVAPFAGGPQDNSQNRGGRVRYHHRQHKGK
jgi:hypothetical protein